MGHPVSLAPGTSVWMAAAGCVVLLPLSPAGWPGAYCGMSPCPAPEALRSLMSSHRQL